ncbi:MAG: hypothetical protein CMQ41_13235 [Gammaproteobacteria bacterium]|nr:hypothetical protein [Gammaproteobacteria bacterium]MBM89331.1 hypothetical protein [Gammaproteobacteria bacterium]
MQRFKNSFVLLMTSLFSISVLAEPEYVTVELEIDINRSAEDVWSRVGGFCDITDWMGLPCELTEGSGGIGTVRSLLEGRITEVLVAKTDLSYGYTMPAVQGEFYNLYHGFMESKAVTATTSKMLYTLVWDVSNHADQAAKDGDIEGRTATFTNALQGIKAYAEAN